MAYDVKRCRYIVKSACIQEEAMIFGRLHAVNETTVMDSVPYNVLAVIVDGTTQIIDLEQIGWDQANG